MMTGSHDNNSNSTAKFCTVDGGNPAPVTIGNYKTLQFMGLSWDKPPFSPGAGFPSSTVGGSINHQRMSGL